MSGWTSSWERASAWINGRSLRERALLLVTVLVAVLLLWDLLLNRPLEARKSALAERQAAAQDTVSQLERSVESMRSQIAALADESGDEDAERALRAAIARADERLDSRAARFIEPDQMVAVLERLLASERELQLVQLVNAPPVRLPGDETVPVYRHQVELVVTGRYLALLDYLRRLEDTGWALQWESLEIESGENSGMRARIRLATLSLAEEWIGV